MIFDGTEGTGRTASGEKPSSLSVVSTPRHKPRFPAEGSIYSVHAATRGSVTSNTTVLELELPHVQFLFTLPEAHLLDVPRKSASFAPTKAEEAF